MRRMRRPIGEKEHAWGGCVDQSAKRNTHEADASTNRRKGTTIVFDAASPWPEYAIMPSCPHLIGFIVRCEICEFRSPTGVTFAVRIACHLTSTPGSSGTKFCLLKRLRGLPGSFLDLASRKSGLPAANHWCARISIG